MEPTDARPLRAGCRPILRRRSWKSRVSIDCFLSRANSASRPRRADKIPASKGRPLPRPEARSAMATGFVSRFPRTRMRSSTRQHRSLRFPKPGERRRTPHSTPHSRFRDPPGNDRPSPPTHETRPPRRANGFAFGPNSFESTSPPSPFHGASDSSENPTRRSKHLGGIDPTPATPRRMPIHSIESAPL